MWKFYGYTLLLPGLLSSCQHEVLEGLWALNTPNGYQIRVCIHTRHVYMRNCCLIAQSLMQRPQIVCAFFEKAVLI